MRACKNTRARIERAADGRLSFEDELLIEEHIDQCADCHEVHARSRALENTLATLAAKRTSRPDVDRAVASIRRTLDVADTEPKIVRPFPWRAVCAAAALILVTLTLATLDGPLSNDESERAPEPDVAAVPADIVPVRAPEVAETSIDHDLLAAKRREVLAHVAAAAAEVDPEVDADHFVLRLEERCEELVRDGWPVHRIIAGALDSQDEALTVAAARYLGRSGDETSLSALNDSLKRGHASQRTRAAIATALVDASGRELRGLERTIWLKGLASCARDEELFAIVLPVLERLESSELMDWIDGMQRRRDGVTERVAPLLVRHGDEGAQRLYELAARSALSTQTAIDLLARCSGTADLIERAVSGDGPRFDTDLVLRIIERSPERSSLAWVARQSESRRHAAQATRTLAAFDDPQAVIELANLSESAIVREIVWLDALRKRIESSPSLAANAAVLVLADGRHERARVLADGLVMTESPASVPALLELARSPVLKADRRETLLLAVRDLATAEHASAITRIFRELATGDETLAAICLLALHAVAGEEALGAALDLHAPNTRARIARHLSRSDERTKTGVILIKVARELKSSSRDVTLTNRSSS